MVNKLINLKGSFTKTLLLEDNSLWFSSEKFTDEISLKSIIDKNTSKPLNGNIHYALIEKIEMNEDSKKIKLKYKGEDDETISFIFESIELAHKIGEFIAGKTLLKKSIKIESSLKKLLYENNIIWVLITILITFLVYFKFFMIGFYEKGKLFRILTLMHDSIGTKGILIVGFLITSYFVIKIFRRFSKTVNDIIFQ
ncbi:MULTISPECIES: hypothetical protein [unclassified Tenacibaculum]|uniref:hypothetical protein n=1 Tax=unclassified Tenacibaculum TaxID=2635139 RepID=UPI001F48F0AE|nr:MULTISPECIES: hypothetical protein [unclassified Tenacibaculum]MCF2875440.1 hypothetical protein [Tenacibaculum sp. Cn5-1]MCF2935516.1 hypothetical protein [Tenacibaculum sp. Cn5-34]MCG7512076.1 hypothetical protein [Tenacibaculum sp. Cn5-46]